MTTDLNACFCFTAFAAMDGMKWSGRTRMLAAPQLQSSAAAAMHNLTSTPRVSKGSDAAVYDDLPPRRVDFLVNLSAHQESRYSLCFTRSDIDFGR